MPAITPEESHVAEVVGEKNDGAILAATEESNDNATKAEDTPQYLQGWTLWYLGMALMSSGFVLSLDNTILGTHLRVYSMAISSNKHSSNGNTSHYE